MDGVTQLIYMLRHMQHNRTKSKGLYDGMSHLQLLIFVFLRSLIHCSLFRIPHDCRQCLKTQPSYDEFLLVGKTSDWKTKKKMFGKY